VRVLLVRAGALGDVLLLRRAVAALRRGGHEPALMAPSTAVAALVGSGPSEVTALLPWEAPATAALLADGELPSGFQEKLARFDLAVCYTRDPDLPVALGRHVPLVRSHPPLPPPSGPHASEWLLEPLSELAEDGPVPPLAFSAAERASARNRLDIAVGRPALHPGSGSPTKNWPRAHFARLAAEWGRAGPWLLVEGPADREAAAELRALPGACVADSLPPRILGALLAEASVFVGNDSGVTHLAAASGAPTLALFGPSDPALWSPVGERVAWLRADDARLESIPVEQVREALASLREPHAPA